MKHVILAARILLGLLFFVFGLNGILHFLKQPPMPPSDATTFATILGAHGWMTFVAVLMTIAGLLLLVGRFVPLALTILAPILVNIFLFHITLMGGAGIAPGLFAAILEVFLIFVYRESFYSLFHPDPLSQPKL